MNKYEALTADQVDKACRTIEAAKALMIRRPVGVTIGEILDEIQRGTPADLNEVDVLNKMIELANEDNEREERK